MPALPKRTPADHFHITVEEIAEKLRNAHKEEVRASLLIGAGCSVSAGIPACPKLIERIQNDYPRAYARAERLCGGDPNYGQCMAVLDSGERRELIEGYVRDARINWAHMAIACLMARGYVDRVLTTNFDNLVVRAAALLDIFPGVYDMTLYRSDKGEAPLQWDALPKHSVFHLHGQSTGFQLLNTDDDLAKHAPQVGDCFRFSEAARPWIVVGYSGENDPIFRAHIAEAPRFARSLYWVGYKDEGLPTEVHDSLFIKDKHARFVAGTDADLFFIRLGQELGIFPPTLLSDPLAHILQMLDLFTPFPEPDTDVATNILGAARDMVQAAIEAAQSPKSATRPSKTASSGEPPSEAVHRLSLASQASNLRLKGDHQGIVDLYESSKEPERSAIRDDVSVAYFQLGYDAQIKGDNASGEAKAGLLREAINDYRKATEIKPDQDRAFFNWGNALDNLARIAPESERKEIWEGAFDKYEQALKIKPDKYIALNNWGNALDGLARIAPESERKQLWEEAIDKYGKALQIKPDHDFALNNWGNALDGLARIAPESERKQLWEEAIDKYGKALQIKPDYDVALNNWGHTLAGFATVAPEVDREPILREAIDKFRKSLEIKPDYQRALSNLGIVMGEVAKYAPEAEREALEQESKEKLAQAEKLGQK